MSSTKDLDFSILSTEERLTRARTIISQAAALGHSPEKLLVTWDDLNIVIDCEDCEASSLITPQGEITAYCHQALVHQEPCLKPLVTSVLAEVMVNKVLNG